MAPASPAPEAPETPKRGSRTPRAKLAAAAGGLLLLSAVTVLTLTFRSIVQEASGIKIKPSRISLDAQEGRERALMSVDTELAPPGAPTHGLALREGRCDLHGVHNGAPLLSMHLVEALYHGPTRAHFGIELEHGSIQEAFSMMQESSRTPTLDCVLSVELDPFRMGWTFHTRQAVSLPLGKMLEGAGYNVRFVKREEPEVVMPTLANMTAASTATYGLEFVVPTEAVARILPSVEEVPMDIKAGITYVEGDLQAVDSRMHIDAPVEVHEEGTGPSTSTIFAVPVQVAARADLMAAGTVLSAAAIGERAQRDPEASLHYHIQPTAGDSRPPHSVVFAAVAPSSAIAKALGALHTVRLQPDEELAADTLAEALAKGRQLLGRKLSGGTLEGYGVKLHQHLLLDDTLGMRVDLTATGGTPLDPALQIDCRVLARLPDSRQSSWGFGWDWQDGGSAIGTTARLRLDHQTPAISGGLAVSYVDVSTKSSGGTAWSNPEWEHRVTNVTNNLEFSYDGTTQLATFGLMFDMATLGERKWDSDNTATTWATSTDENSPAKVWWGRNSGLRRLLSKAGDVAWQTGTALRRLSIMQSKSESNIPVRVSASMDFNGISPGSVFTAGIRVEGADMVNLTLDWSTTEPATNKYVHNLGVMLDLPEAEEVEAGEVIAPFLAAGTSIQDESRSAEELVKLKMAFQASANVMTDLSEYLKLKVEATVSMNPTCSVSELDEALPKITPLLQNASASFDASNPQCRRCVGGFGKPFSHEGSDRLVSMCSSSKPGWQGTSWGSASSCCDFKGGSGSLMTLGGLLDSSSVPEVIFGSPWTKTFGFEASMGKTLMDIWGLLENELMLPMMAGLPQQIPEAVASTRIVPQYTTQGDTAVRTWNVIIANDDFAKVTMLDKSPDPLNWFNINWDILVDFSGIPMYRLMVKEEWTDQKFLVNMTQVLRYKPEYNLQALALFDTMQDGLDGFTFDHYVKFGADLGQLFRVYAQAMLTDGTIAGRGDVYLGENKMNSALVRFVSAGNGIEGTATVKDGWDMTMGTGEFALLAGADKLTLSGNLSDAWSKLGSMLFNAERLNGGNTFSSSLGVMEGTGAVIAGFSGSFTKTADSLSATLNGQELARASGAFSPATGSLSGALSAAGQEMVRASGSFSPITGVMSAALSVLGEVFQITGSMPKVDSFLVGDVAVEIAGLRQRFMINVSDGYLPFTKAGLSGFRRFYLGGGTMLEGSIGLNASAYWEVPPLDPTSFSGVGIFADVDTLGDGGKNIASVAIDADFPFAKAGWSPTGEQMQVVSEVVTEMKAEVIPDDLSTFNDSEFKAALAQASNLDASKIEVEIEDYKVEVAYEFTAAVTEAEAKISIANALGVRADQVSVTITNSRRRLFSDLLVPRRLLGGLRVDAVITTDTPAAANTIKGKALDTARVSQELTNVGKSSTASIAVQPVAKIDVTMKMTTELSSPRLNTEAVEASMATVAQAIGSPVAMQGDVNRELVSRAVVVITAATTTAQEEVHGDASGTGVTTTEDTDIDKASEHMQPFAAALLIAAISTTMRTV